MSVVENKKIFNEIFSFSGEDWVMRVRMLLMLYETRFYVAALLRRIPLGGKKAILFRNWK